MYDTEAYMKILKNTLSSRRFYHSLCVSQSAKKLAERYNQDVEKAEIAGLLHDITKETGKAAQLEIIKYAGVELHPFDKRGDKFLHQASGSAMAKILGIEDEEILNAVKYHTTGRENMTLLEKIIYMADLIEEGRYFPKVEELRELTYSGKLEEALILSFNNTIKFVIDNNQLIHPRTVKARNYILSKIL